MCNDRPAGEETPTALTANKKKQHTFLLIHNTRLKTSIFKYLKYLCSDVNNNIINNIQI